MPLIIDMKIIYIYQLTSLYSCLWIESSTALLIVDGFPENKLIRFDIGTPPECWPSFKIIGGDLDYE